MIRLRGPSRIVVILSALLCCQVSGGDWKPTGFKSWRDSANASKRAHLFGGSVQNYQKRDSTWAPIENDWVTIDDTLHTNRRGVLKVDVNDKGQSTISLKHGGNTYTISQRLIKLIWLNTGSWNWTDVAPSATWNTPSVDSNIVTWGRVFPGVDYRLRKLNGHVQHGIFFKKAFLDSVVTLYNQRADSLEIALGNVIAYSLSSNIDHADSAIGSLDRRILKQVGSCAFSLRKQAMRFPGADTLDVLPVRQRWVKSAGKIYCVEYVMMSRLKQIHEAYPNATIWHNASATWSSTTIDTWIHYYGGGSGSYYSDDPLEIWDNGFGVRSRSMFYFAGIIDSVGSATVDSALFEAHYSNGAAGNENIQLCRGIADEEWYEDEDCNWNYVVATSSTDWAAGTGDHTSSYTVTNAVTRNIGNDTTSTGWLQFSCKDLVADIVTAGTDYGLWLNPPDVSAGHFDSNDDASGNYPKLYIEYTAGAEEEKFRRRRLLIGNQ